MPRRMDNRRTAAVRYAGCLSSYGTDTLVQIAERLCINIDPPKELESRIIRKLRLQGPILRLNDTYSGLFVEANDIPPLLIVGRGLIDRSSPQQSLEEYINHKCKYSVKHKKEDGIISETDVPFIWGWELRQIFFTYLIYKSCLIGDRPDRYNLDEFILEYIPDSVSLWEFRVDGWIHDWILRILATGSNTTDLSQFAIRTSLRLSSDTLTASEVCRDLKALFASLKAVRADNDRRFQQMWLAVDYICGGDLMLDPLTERTNLAITCHSRDDDDNVLHSDFVHSDAFEMSLDKFLNGVANTHSQEIRVMKAIKELEDRLEDAEKKKTRLNSEIADIEARQLRTAEALEKNRDLLQTFEGKTMLEMRLSDKRTAEHDTKHQTDNLQKRLVDSEGSDRAQYSSNAGLAPSDDVYAEVGKDFVHEAEEGQDKLNFVDVGVLEPETKGEGLHRGTMVLWQSIKRRPRIVQQRFLVFCSPYAHSGKTMLTTCLTITQICLGFVLFRYLVSQLSSSFAMTGPISFKLDSQEGFRLKEPLSALQSLLFFAPIAFAVVVFLEQ